MNNFYVDGRERYKYGLRMRNYAEIKRMMCGNKDNCFASPSVGFSTQDKDRDSYHQHCSNHYRGVGWLQAHCYHHHQTAPGVSQGEFAGCQGTGVRELQHKAMVVVRVLIRTQGNVRIITTPHPPKKKKKKRGESTVCRTHWCLKVLAHSF